MANSNRIFSIDIMRGLTLLLMLFVNDLNMDIAPKWLGHMKADFDGIGLADVVFPGFLFIVGLAIPFALLKRYSGGDPPVKIARHIFTRSLSLLIIGVLMLNTGRVNPELTGMSETVWSLLMYLAVFLFWNDYRNTETKFFTVTGLRLLALAIFVFLIFKFRSGRPENSGSLITGWWGILGLIGWGYLVSAFTYMLCRDSIPRTIGATLFFLFLNILSGLKMLEFLNPVKPYLGVIIEGNVPFIVLTGLTGGLILQRFSGNDYKKVILIFILSGVFCIGAAFLLRNWFIFSKIKATPSWGMLCNGISLLAFALIYWISDVKKKQSWALFVKPAGENSLTTYLAPDILYYIFWMTGLPVFFYKNSTEPMVVVAGSIIWALLMMGLTALLARINIRLKL